MWLFILKTNYEEDVKNNNIRANKQKTIYQIKNHPHRAGFAATYIIRSTALTRLINVKNVKLSGTGMATAHPAKRPNLKQDDSSKKSVKKTIHSDVIKLRLISVENLLTFQ